MIELSQTTADHKTSIFEYTMESLGEFIKSLGEPTYRVKQVFEWVYGRGVNSFDDMTNLSKALRDKLSERLTIYESLIIRELQAKDGTIKLLLQWRDGATSECVLIPDEARQTACISTQVGCPVGCVFCASGLDGLQRQLSGGQIIEQAMRIRQCCDTDQRLSNVVFMGLGEPLANYDATVQAVRTINAPWGLGIGARKITVSTVGLPSQIKKLAAEQIQITLALSLHAPTDELREQIIPWAKRVSIQELIEACTQYFEKTGREITLEYILLGGVNDDQECARSLIGVYRRIRCNVNLIAFNPVDGLPYRRPNSDTVSAFQNTLQDAGVNVHVRRSRGQDIDAACGQLRRREGATTG